MEWAEIHTGIVIVSKKPSQNSSPTNLFISRFLMEKRLFSQKLNCKSKYFPDKQFTLNDRLLLEKRF